MGFGKAMLWMLICGLMFTVIGAGIGYLIGTSMPGYYRSIFGGTDPNFDPVTFGLGPKEWCWAQ